MLKRQTRTLWHSIRRKGISWQRWNAQSEEFLEACPVLWNLLNGLSFSKIAWNLASRRLCRSFQFSFQFCILLDVSLKYFCVVQLLVRAGRFIIYFDSHQPILSNSPHHCSIWQVLLLKSLSFFSSLWMRLLDLLSVSFPKEAQYVFWLIKSFVLLLLFSGRLSSLWSKTFSWFNLNFCDCLSWDLMGDKNRRIKEKIVNTM